MDSNKSRPPRARRAVEPQRKPGRERVAALLEAAAAVIAERGYEAATMTEIASRAGALVGSLYHFFPNKEAVGEALIRRFEELIDGAFDEVDAKAASGSSDELADAMIDLMLGLKGPSEAMVPLMEGRPEWSVRWKEFLEATLRRIAGALTIRSPGLPADEAWAMAVVLLNNMKAAKHLTADPAASAEVRAMTRLYLEHRLAR